MCECDHPNEPDADAVEDLSVSLDRHFMLWFAEYGARCWVVLPNGQMVPTVDDATRERLFAEYFERLCASLLYGKEEGSEARVFNSGVSLGVNFT